MRGQDTEEEEDFKNDGRNDTCQEGINAPGNAEIQRGWESGTGPKAQTYGHICIVFAAVQRVIGHIRGRSWNWR